MSQPRNRNEFNWWIIRDFYEKNTLLGYNRYNCNFYNITPIEGSVLVFHNLTHGTQKIMDRTDERLVIAGDIRVTLKPEHYKHHQGCTHPSQWLQL